MSVFDDTYLEETLETALGNPDVYYVPTGITRYDYAKMHGWWVRLHRDEAKFQELFYDSHHPTISEGLRAAILYRHEILSSFPLEKSVRGRPFKSLSPDPLDRISRRTAKGKLQPYIYWHATWYDEDHKLKHRSFSVKKFGEDEARNLALECATKLHNKTPKPIKDMANADTHAKQKFRAMSREDVEILSTINSGPYKSNNNDEIETVSNDPFAFEGEKRLKLHMAIERDKKLRNAKVSEFLRENGAIFCELCSFRFTKVYPFLENDIIEVHHMVPLSNLSGRTKITLNDLILLCPNCHMAVHQGDEEENMILAMDYFKR